MYANSQKSRIAKTFGKICRWVSLTLVTSLVLWLLFIGATKLLQYRAVSQIAELTNTRIKVDSVDFDINGSVLIKGLAIRPNGGQKWQDAILTAETVYAKFSLGSILLFRPRLKKIDVHGFVFNAVQNLDTGQWNISALKIKISKGGSSKMPEIILKKGVLRYKKALNGIVKVAAAIPLDARFNPEQGTEGVYEFHITTAKRKTFGRSVLNGHWKPGQVALTGGISSTFIPAFEKAWLIDVIAAQLNYQPDNSYSLKLTIKDLLSKSEVGKQKSGAVKQVFFDKFRAFSALESFLSNYQPSGCIDIQFEAVGKFDQLDKSKLTGKLYCKDVSICNDKFRYPIEHLQGWIDLTSNSISLNNLCGQHKSVGICFNGYAKKLDAGLEYQIELTSDNMVLDNDLYEALNPGHRKLWDGFSPSGIVGVKHSSIKRPQSERSDTLLVKLQGVDAKYIGFPYPLRNLEGKLSFDSNNIIISDLVSESNDIVIKFDGKVTDRKSAKPKYNILARASNVPLDSELMDALPEEQRNFYNQFEIDGTIDSQVRIFTPEEGLSKTSFLADVSFADAHLKFKKLETKISDITGCAEFGPKFFTLKDVTGRFEGSEVSLSGKIWPHQKSEEVVCDLLLYGKEVEFNKKIIGLLPTGLAQFISDIQPTGKIDYNVQLRKEAGKNSFRYQADVNFLGNTVNCKWFPYPVKNITGSLKATNERLSLKNICGTPADNIQMSKDSSKIRLDGDIELVDNRFSSAVLSIFANDIALDERLCVALPATPGKYYSGILPTGRFDLSFENLNIQKMHDGEKRIDLDGNIKFKGCGFKTSPEISELDAVLKIKGSYNNIDGFANAQTTFLADSLRIQGKQLTNLTADVNYDDQLRVWTSRNLIANSYGGKLAGKFEIKKASNLSLEYSLQAGFGNVQLKQFLSDKKTNMSGQNDYSSGAMDGSLSVCGNISNKHSRLGTCRLEITDMQVGKLSPIAKLLQVLQLNEPTDYAFDKMVVDSYLKNDNLFIREIDLSGKSLAFNGAGQLNISDMNVDLVFTARGNRLLGTEASVVQFLTEGISRAVVRVDVHGHVYDPKITKKHLPFILDAIGLLGTKPKKNNKP